MKRIRPLSEAECETLLAAWKDRPNSRVRQRAQAVYLAHRGYGRIALSLLFKVDVDTIGVWLDGWEQDGLCGLHDNPRSGRPRIRAPAEEARGCAAGWRRSPAKSSGRKPGWSGRRAKRASRQTVHRIVKKSLPLEGVPATGQKPT